MIVSAYENQSVENNDLFVEKHEGEEIEDEESKQERLAKESAQTQCDLCNEHIDNSDMTHSSLRLPDCRHLLCYRCCCQTINLNTYECPIVDCAVHFHIPSSQLSIYSLPFSSNNERQVIIQFGNFCKSTASSGQRYEYLAFVKCTTKNIIDTVSFDINPGYPKSAIRVSQPPYELIRTMNAEFVCNLIIQWNKTLNWPNLKITYDVQNKQERFTRNLLVRIPKRDKPTIKSHQAREEIIYRWSDRDKTKPSMSYILLSNDP